MIKILLGGSPCTFWSLAQTKNRETEAKGLGWELFKNYLIAKQKFKPDFFLYENNKSAAKPIKEQIAKELGVDLMYINSALVSGQNRERFYCFNWEVEQPEDRGILLQDVLETCGVRIPEYGDTNKSRPVMAAYSRRGVSENQLVKEAFPDSHIKQVCDYIAVPINTTEDGKKARCLMAGYYKCGTATILTNKGFTGGTTAVAEKVLRVPEATKKGYAEIAPGECVDLTQPNSKTRRGRRMAEKANCLTKSPQYFQYMGAAGEMPYPVKNGLITIKGKEYPVKLLDGEYYIRKLTPVECERLQTLPDNYTEGVSNTQRYKGLGNGWTAEVIIHILQGALKDVPKDEEIVVLSMYDGIGTGRYCLDKMGFTNVKYFAYEIDKYAKEIALKNYPDIIQMGDAFQLRHPDWTIGY